MKFLRKLPLLVLFLLSACKFNNDVLTEKVGNYKVVRNVFYRFVREKYAFEIFLPSTEEKTSPDYLVSVWDHVYNFNGYRFYDENGDRIFNEFVVEKRFLIIYDE